MVKAKQYGTTLIFNLENWNNILEDIPINIYDLVKKKDYNWKMNERVFYN